MNVFSPVQQNFHNNDHNMEDDLQLKLQNYLNFLYLQYEDDFVESIPLACYRHVNLILVRLAPTNC